MALRQIHRRLGSQSGLRFSGVSPVFQRRYKSHQPDARDTPNPLSAKPDQAVDIEALLSEPTWSIQSLLPQSSSSSSSNPSSNPDREITPAQLHHLLRLSALPAPKNAEEESSMLNTLAAQLNFVRQIQAVDTRGVEPLRAIRDETAEADADREIGLESDGVREALEREEVVGKHFKRIKRRDEEDKTVRDRPSEEWRPLEAANKRRGRYFVVNSGKGEEEE